MAGVAQSAGSLASREQRGVSRPHTGRPAHHSYSDRRPPVHSASPPDPHSAIAVDVCARRLNTEISGQGGRGDRSHLTVHLETVSKYLMAGLLLDFASKYFSTS